MFKKKYMILTVILFIFVTACNKSNVIDSELLTESKEHLPLGKYKQPVTLSIGMGVDPNFRTYTGETPANNLWVTAIQHALNVNVKIDWFVVNQNIEQKVDLAISSNTLPDAMVVSEFQLNQMVKADELEDLSEAYRSYASPVMKTIMDSTNGIAEEHVTFNGKMLALPSAYAEDMSMMWVRKDWLDRLDLQPPSTMDELEQVAKAFVERDPDGNGQADTVGIAAGTPLFDGFHAGPGSFNFNPIFSAYQAYPGFWLMGADGKPVYGSIQPEMKEALAKLRELYARGLIDQEMGIRESAAEVVINGKAGIFFAPAAAGYWPIPDALKNNPRANWQAYALPLDVNGKFNAKVFKPSISFVVVRKGYEHPEAVIKIANLILRDEYKYGIDFQPLRNTIAPRDEISFSVQALNDVLTGIRQPADFAHYREYSLLHNDLNTIKNTKLAPYDNMDIQYWNLRSNHFKRSYSLLVGGRNLLDPNLHKVNSIYHSHTETMESKWRHLLDTEMDLFTQIIMGVAPLSVFDQWVEDWKRQGGDEITAEVADAIQP